MRIYYECFGCGRVVRLGFLLGPISLILLILLLILLLSAMRITVFIGQGPFNISSTVGLPIRIVIDWGSNQITPIMVNF